MSTPRQPKTPTVQLHEVIFLALNKDGKGGLAFKVGENNVTSIMRVGAEGRYLINKQTTGRAGIMQEELYFEGVPAQERKITFIPKK